MTELWACTDCGDEVDFDTRREHMKDEHGITYVTRTLESGRVEFSWHSVRECPVCTDTEPCEGVKALEGAK